MHESNCPNDVISSSNERSLELQHNLFNRVSSRCIGILYDSEGFDGFSHLRGLRISLLEGSITANFANEVSYGWGEFRRMRRSLFDDSTEYRVDRGGNFA